MYNKIFTKILDSSIWLEPTPTRLLWVTLIAAMDEDGFASFASVANLAHRARLSVEETTEAVNCLEAPDKESSDPEHDGRRIERVPGGWMILNAKKYRDLVTRTVAKEQTRIRVARHREKKRSVTPCNAAVTAGNGNVTPSEAVAEAVVPPTPQKTPPVSEPAAPRAGVREGKDSRLLPTTDQSRRVARIFHRALTTAWSEKEVASYRKIGTIPETDLVALETYYAANWPPCRDKNILRHDLVTFLNNLPGEIDRAHASKSKGKTSKANEWLDSTPKLEVLPDPAEIERIRADAKAKAEEFRKSQGGAA